MDGGGFKRSTKEAAALESPDEPRLSLSLDPFRPTTNVQAGGRQPPTCTAGRWINPQEPSRKGLLGEGGCEAALFRGSRLTGAENRFDVAVLRPGTLQASHPPFKGWTPRSPPGMRLRRPTLPCRVSPFTQSYRRFLDASYRKFR